MITKIYIDGFKSFQDFEMTFTPLTVIAGVNASGKSNLFDALNLLSRLAETDLKTAFSEQRGNADELFTQYADQQYADEMKFVVEMLVNRKIKDNWGGERELNNTRLKYELVIAKSKNEFGLQDFQVKLESLEKIKPENDTWSTNYIPTKLKALWKAKNAGGSKEPFIKTEKQNETIAIKIRQDGGGHGKATPALAVAQTVIGGINSVDFPHAFAAKEEMRSWRFLQLNPEDLREPTKQDAGIRYEISSTGKNMAAALHKIKQRDPYSLKEISRKINSFLPGFTEIDVVDDRANRQYIIRLKGEDNKWFSSRVLSEGTLRILALCILEYDEQYTGLLSFEEPENGIHPFRINSVALLLKALTSSFDDDGLLRQVIVNTHSPVLISELISWNDDKFVSIWFSKQNTLIKELNSTKVKFKVTRFMPVYKSNQLTFFEDDNVKKITAAEAIKYLQTSDAESAMRILQS